VAGGRAPTFARGLSRNAGDPDARDGSSAIVTAAGVVTG
jgi:hypothetical protein